MKDNILIKYNNTEDFKTSFDGQISSVELNGQKINDVHDLTEKVISMTKTIKVLAFTATALAVIAVATVLFLTHWLLSHDSDIETLLLTTNKAYSQKIADAEKWNSHRRERAYIHLEEFHALHWDEGMQDWVNHAIIREHEKPRS